MPPSSAQGAARTGRRIGIALFWCMAVFVIGMSSRSVLGELYGSSHEASAAGEAACAQQLRALEQSLREHAADELLLSDPSPRRSSTWLGTWDREYEAIGPCGSLEEARLTLGDLRARTAAMLQQHTRRSAPLTERIERALDRFEPRSSSRPPKET